MIDVLWRELTMKNVLVTLLAALVIGLAMGHWTLQEDGQDTAIVQLNKQAPPEVDLALNLWEDPVWEDPQTDTPPYSESDNPVKADDAEEVKIAGFMWQDDPTSGFMTDPATSLFMWDEANPTNSVQPTDPGLSRALWEG